MQLIVGHELNPHAPTRTGCYQVSDGAKPVVPFKLQGFWLSRGTPTRGPPFRTRTCHSRLNWASVT